MPKSKQQHRFSKGKMVYLELVKGDDLFSLSINSLILRTKNAVFNDPFLIELAKKLKIQSVVTTNDLLLISQCIHNAEKS